MVNIEEMETRTIKTIEHYYCDRCGKDIGSSVMLADGYCPTPNTVHKSGIHWIFGRDKPKHGWYSLPGEYCADCAEQIEKEVFEFFDKMGIVKEDY